MIEGRSLPGSPCKVGQADEAFGEIVVDPGIGPEQGVEHPKHPAPGLTPRLTPRFTSGLTSGFTSGFTSLFGFDEEWADGAGPLPFDGHPQLPYQNAVNRIGVVDPESGETPETGSQAFDLTIIDTAITDHGDRPADNV
jgi:hypothetical protein